MTEPENDPFLGKRIREYEILDIIGRGGMGAVYRARHVYLDEQRAIKVIESQSSTDRDFIDRFIREARVLRKLNHPNLVQLFEFGTLENNLFFMVLELLRGESVLARVSRLKRIPIVNAIKIVHEAALGLQSAHEKGIVHRDISPDNIFLVQDAQGNEITKVIDFGIAKPTWSSGLTAVNLFIGKPEFCSPEQCGKLDEGEVIDGRSDIYSLAVCLYYMLAGQLPFSSHTSYGLIVKHLSEVPAPVSSHFKPAELPQDLDRLISKALSKDRDQRPATMNEFALALEQIAPSRFVPVEMVGMKTEVVYSELPTGKLFGQRYLVQKKIGSGRIATVYKAIDRILDVPVALKIMNPDVVHDRKTLEGLKREVIQARRVAHPNACRIFDIGEVSGTHYISMEFLEGKTLAEIIKERGPLPLEMGIPIIRQVLEALREAHRVGVIHRALKPQNIIVDSHFRAVAMDFGILISPDSKLITLTGLQMSTAQYMAPEQFTVSDVDHRADIYSLGVILFEVFAGRLPFDANTPVEMMNAHMHSPPMKPSTLVPQISPMLERVILKALEKDREKRFQQVSEVLRELKPLDAPSTVGSGYQNEMTAFKLLSEKSYTRAIQHLSKLQSSHPQSQDWKKLLGIAVSAKVRKGLRRVRLFIRERRYEDAYSLLETLSALNPDEERTVKQLANARSHLEKHKEQNKARSAKEPVDSMAPTISVPATTIQEVQQQKPGNELEIELAEIEEVIDADADAAREKAKAERVWELFKQGELNFERNQWKEAMDAWNSALELAPKDESLQQWINAAATRLERENEVRKVAADEEYRHKIQEGTDHVHAKRWNEALKCFLIAGEIRRGESELETFITLTSEKARKQFQLQSKLHSASVRVDSSLKMRHYDQAIQLCTEVLRDDFSEFALETDMEIIRRQLAYAQSRMIDDLNDQAAEQLAAGIPSRGVSLENPIVPTRRGWRNVLLLCTLVLLVAASIAGVWFVFRSQPNRTNEASNPLGKPPVIAPITSPANVAINVLPWARVKIVPGSKDFELADHRAERITPFFTTLPEGEYQLEIRRDGAAPLFRRIQVKRGKSNVFLFTSLGYDPSATLKRVMVEK